MQENNELVDGRYYLIKQAEQYFIYQGAVADKASLPIDAPIGYVYQVEANQLFYVQTDSGYVPFGPEVSGALVSYLSPISTVGNLPSGEPMGTMVTALDTGITYIFDGTLWRSLGTSGGSSGDLEAFLLYLDPRLDYALGYLHPLVINEMLRSTAMAVLLNAEIPDDGNAVDGEMLYSVAMGILESLNTPNDDEVINSEMFYTDAMNILTIT